MHFVAYGLAALAILVMGSNVFLAVRLRRAIVGGEVGEKWGLLTALVVFFFAGYLLSPLALYFELPSRYLNLLVFAVFLFGAVFVWVVIGIIRDTLTFLKLVK
jgi:fructose-specific phosphotransferase system IIC component